MKKTTMNQDIAGHSHSHSQEFYRNLLWEIR